MSTEGGVGKVEVISYATKVVAVICPYISPVFLKGVGRAHEMLS